MAGTAHLVFDIETICDGELVRRVHYAHQNEMSSTEALDNYRKELLQLSDGRSDFVPHTFHIPVSIAVIGVGLDFSILGMGTLDRPNFRPSVLARKFWDAWLRRGTPQLVSFNGRGFDIPVLEMCAFRYGISVPGWFKQNGSSYQQPRNRYNTHAHLDLMDFLSNYGAVRMAGGLHLCASLLDKPGKMETQGSMVQALWDSGQSLRVDDYCLCDALDTYFAFLRCQVLLGSLDLEKEHKLVEEAHRMIQEKTGEYPGLLEYLKKFRFWQAPPA